MRRFHGPISLSNVLGKPFKGLKNMMYSSIATSEDGRYFASGDRIARNVTVYECGDDAWSVLYVAKDVGFPIDMCFAGNNLLVCDNSNKRIVELDIHGSIVRVDKTNYGFTSIDCRDDVVVLGSYSKVFMYSYSTRALLRRWTISRPGVILEVSLSRDGTRVFVVHNLNYCDSIMEFDGNTGEFLGYALPHVNNAFFVTECDDGSIIVISRDGHFCMYDAKGQQINTRLTYLLGVKYRRRVKYLGNRLLLIKEDGDVYPLHLLWESSIQRTFLAACS